jgi:hypothetical protein
MCMSGHTHTGTHTKCLSMVKGQKKAILEKMAYYNDLSAEKHCGYC